MTNESDHTTVPAVQPTGKSARQRRSEVIANCFASVFIIANVLAALQSLMFIWTAQSTYAPSLLFISACSILITATCALLQAANGFPAPATVTRTSKGIAKMVGLPATLIATMLNGYYIVQAVAHIVDHQVTPGSGLNDSIVLSLTVASVLGVLATCGILWRELILHLDAPVRS